ERLVGLRLGAYVASKVTVLVPFLLLVVVAMLGVLRGLDRLPGRSVTTYASIGVGLLLCAIAALGLGLLASAAVGHVAQATLALRGSPAPAAAATGRRPPPVALCPSSPPGVFSAPTPRVPLGAPGGRGLGVVTPPLWAFGALGHARGARRTLAHGGSRLAPPL